MENKVSVLKFGGTSVGSGERIRQVASIIAHAVNGAEEHFPIIVVSAMAGVTDQLLKIARHAYAGQYEECEAELTLLRHKHMDATQEVTCDDKRRMRLLVQIEDALTALAQDVATLRSAAQRNDEIQLHTAAVAGWGERLSVLLVAAAVGDLGVATEPILQEIIITSHPRNDSVQPFGVVVGADPLMEETRANAHALVVPLIERRIVPILVGFIGRTITGYVTTLGRNASDYCATVIGVALGCAEVTIYTDVDGVLTADPRLVKNAQPLSRLSYAEAARLSWFGAKVLHPRTFIPVAPRNIPVRVRNTFRPHVLGTVVGPVGRTPSGARAITTRRHLALITVESTDLFGAPENAGQIFALAARAYAAPIVICSSSGHHLSFMVEEASAESVVALLRHDMDASVWNVRCVRNLAACACIGSGFNADPMSAAHTINALASADIPIVTQGMSDQAIILIVEDQDAESALCWLHRGLIATIVPFPGHQEKRREAR
ncbi:MAG: aspartate kinase [Chloroflexi bacterium]|nr:aspartate kinase [Chloroflexota bacterium]